MGSEIYNNLDLKKKASLDARLESVADVASLPDPTVSTNFIYEGAIIYVQDVKVNYQAQDVSGTLTWVNIGGEASQATAQGTINILASTTNLDLNQVSPAIATCDSVIINITNGTSATIASISNFPADVSLDFTTSDSQQINFTHEDYDSATTDQIVLENGFDTFIKGRSSANDILTLKREGIVNVQVGATQFLTSSEYAQNLFSISVEDSLTSTSPTKALSANQGSILNASIAGKQNTLTFSSNLSYTGGTVDIQPWAWTKLTIPGSPVADVQTYLTGTYGSTATDTYRFLDLTSHNQGSWLLPVRLDPSVYANWVKIQGEDLKNKSVVYPIFAEPDLDTAKFDANNYIVKILATQGVGDETDVNPSFNSDGSSTQKVSFTLPAGNYKVKLKLMVNSDHLADFTTTMYKFGGVASNLTPIPGGAAAEDAFAIPTGVVTAANGSYTVESFRTIAATVNDGYSFSIVSSGGFLNSLINATTPGFLEIIKY